MNTIDFNLPFTQYYFDKFIVGSHHSIPHLCADLESKKSQAHFALSNAESDYKKQNIHKFLKMIDTELKKYTMSDLGNIEDYEPIYWTNRLGRQSALEISTYGRIRPETMDMLMCLDDDEFSDAMEIAGKLSSKIEKLGIESLNIDTPVPPTMPVIS